MQRVAGAPLLLAVEQDLPARRVRSPAYGAVIGGARAAIIERSFREETRPIVRRAGGACGRIDGPDSRGIRRPGLNSGYARMAYFEC